ncbi:MAG: phospholipase D-like domain-containing protein, partial [Nitrososphaeraceae archaeon]
SVGRVEDQFGTPNRRGTITLEVEIFVPVIARRNQDDGQPDQYVCCKYYFPHQLESSQWIDWLRIWGFRTRLITMPEEVYLRIQEQMKQSGFIKEWEVISAALTKSKNGSPYSVVSIKRNKSSQMIVKKTITNLIVNAKKRIYIAVQMIDNSLLNELIAAIDRGLDVRIIIGIYEAKWLHSRDRRGIFIATISQKISLRIKDDFHGRMIIIDDVIFVGSIDLDSQGLSVHDNIVVQAQDATAVTRGIETFLELEKESKPLELNNEHSRDN